MHLPWLFIAFTCPHWSSTWHHTPSVHWIPGFIWRECLSKAQEAIQGEHLPAEVSYHDVLQSGKGPGEDDKDADELSRDTSWQFVRVFSFVDQQGGWSQAIMQVKTGDGMWRSCTDVGTCGLQSCGQILAKHWRGNVKWTFSSGPTALGEHICVIVLCDKAAHLRAAFYFDRSKANLCTNHAV